LGLEQWLSWTSASCQLKLWNSIFPIFLKKFVSDKQDMQAGLERGLISPKVLQTFFELDKHPYIAELSRRFQVAIEALFLGFKMKGYLGCKRTVHLHLAAKYLRQNVQDTINKLAIFLSQGLRERWLADPRFLQRLGIEETISITTTLIAQYERRGTRFWSEIEYVITDTVRAVAVDFFTVWLPAPTLSFRSLDSQVTCNLWFNG
jgi:hypothetical protein